MTGKLDARARRIVVRRVNDAGERPRCPITKLVSEILAASTTPLAVFRAPWARARPAS
jgi:hypothetical protein